MNSKYVNSIAELESLYPKPLVSSLAKELPMLNEHYRRLIEASPFVSVTSVDPEGMDCSPRGEAPRVCIQTGRSNSGDSRSTREQSSR